MVEDKLKEKIWNYCPPIVVWLVGMIFLFNAKIADYPINDDYYLSWEVILVLLGACLWVMIFTPWAMWFKHSPRFYRDSVYSDLKELRRKFYDIDEFYSSALPWALMQKDIRFYMPNLPSTHRPALADILQLMTQCEFYYEDRKTLGPDKLPNEIAPQTYELMKKIRDFEKATDWALKK